ncbi:hypothetical protein ACHAXR_000684, partial [Thalassiosira sp. AJA248-18]
MASRSMWALTLFLYSFATHNLWDMCCAFVLPPRPPMMQNKRFYLINDEQPVASKKTAAEDAVSHLSKIPIVICPGFCNDKIDYSNPLNQGDDCGFVSTLARRGFDPKLIKTMPLERYEWIRVAAGLFDFPNFYTGNCRPEGLGYGWYVRRLRKTIEQAYEMAGRKEKVILIGHSAGGWLARAALGDGSWDVGCDGDKNGDELNGEARASDRVRALFTIGAIHKPPAGSAASTCVTRGVLSYLDQTYPGAFLSDEGIAYVSVGGDAVLGRQQEQTSASSDEAKEESTSSVAYTVYEA